MFDSVQIIEIVYSKSRDFCVF